ncbi:GNAT family N-acetyltransferase [Nakamurella sp. YIM 132087]|uniref:GNAT family N-acetyltransferase n=1 Tax=Nakamurella alba TaxID=2665158 RepID=A0A7K1FIQ4_9ACTN|nr:GNAT family N-acetyltransferase [Nakamurella alba]MTD14007.1 GNAT family N-acetyltransferase [Nakamurella alba]
MTVSVEPATPARWTDVVEAFGRGGRRPDSCWCQRFRRHDCPDNRTALHLEVSDGPLPVGLVAYHDGTPSGWCRVVPRSTLPGITGNRALQRVLDDDPDAWWVSCVVVRQGHRGHGIGAALLRRAAVFAADHGASVLDGHPVDVGVVRGRPAPTALFTGTVSIFRAAGFGEFGRTVPTRPVMRQRLR